MLSRSDRSECPVHLDGALGCADEPMIVECAASVVENLRFGRPDGSRAALSDFETLVTSIRRTE